MAQQGFAGKLKIRPELYEVTLDFDSIDIERGTALIQATEKATRIGRTLKPGGIHRLKGFQRDLSGSEKRFRAKCTLQEALGDSCGACFGSPPDRPLPFLSYF